MLESDLKTALALVRELPDADETYQRSNIRTSKKSWWRFMLLHGLIRSSFVPPAPIHELRDLTRTRKQLVREIAQHTFAVKAVARSSWIVCASVTVTSSGCPQVCFCGRSSTWPSHTSNKKAFDSANRVAVTNSVP